MCSKQVVGNKFFGHQLVDLCNFNEPAKQCLSKILDQITAIEKDIENLRLELAKNTSLLSFGRPLIEINSRQDTLAGLESIATYVLREGCSNKEQPKDWPDEQTCIEDASHIPKFDQTLMQIYVDKVEDSIKNDKLLLSQEDRLGQAINLLSRLQSDIARQTEQREEIKAGFWINRRYAIRQAKSYLQTDNQNAQSDSWYFTLISKSYIQFVPLSFYLLAYQALSSNLTRQKI